MIELLLGLIVVIISIGGLSIGLLLNNKPLKGSCGGLNSQGECEICGKTDPKHNSR